MAEEVISKTQENLSETTPKIKKSKKKKKEKKRKRRESEATAEASEPEDETSPKSTKITESKVDASDDKEARKRARKAERQSRKQQDAALMEKVPKVDETGISYTKLQMKRMLKRIKQGLPPVATEAEENERRRNEAQLRREEEAELAGMIFNREEEEEEDNDDDDDEQAEGDAVDKDDTPSESAKDETETRKEVPADSDNKAPPQKKSKRSKEVPVDYVCQACKNKHQPVHWIYDCPDKVTVRGTNQKRKKDRGFHAPDSRKVFVSGLPFEIKPSDVEQIFKGCGKVVNCRLVKFNDTGRCNGQAYVAFDTDAGAGKALKLSGTTIDSSIADNDKKKSKKSNTTKRKELKLKISKVLNRRLTKNVKA